VAIVTNSGIYQIKALHSGEIYIGSSSNLEQRERDHFRFLRYGTHDNPKLQASYNKYGPENFVFQVLVYCEPENCLDVEQVFFDAVDPHFNVVKIAGKPPSRKGKTWCPTDTQRENIKKSAIIRGKKQVDKRFLDNTPLYEEIKNSGLSVRKFCALRGMMPNRTSINAGYRRYLSET
jgi:group I intron endonuclease